jgi:LmbE family N-acetylglucosaminyl deacetylase
VTRIVEDARFDAKLTKIDLPGEPIYPRWLFHYYCTHLRIIPSPSFLLDITGYESRKRDAIVAYETQFVIPEKNRRVVEWVEHAGAYFGSRIGVSTAEPFFAHEPIGLGGLSDLAIG